MLCFSLKKYKYCAILYKSNVWGVVMKKGILTVSILTVVAVIAVLVGSFVTNSKIERKCEKYKQALSGHTYRGYDSTTTVKHGNVSYHYTMVLNEDGSCSILFKAVRTGDNSTFSKNGTTEFSLDALNWSIIENDDKYGVFISGDWDWQGWSAAEINREIEIIDNGEDIAIKGVRSGYYEFYFEEIN